MGWEGISGLWRTERGNQVAEDMEESISRYEASRREYDGMRTEVAAVHRVY